MSAGYVNRFRRCVAYDAALTSPFVLLAGVLQGSALVPLLFILIYINYINDLYDATFFDYLFFASDVNSFVL